MAFKSLGKAIKKKLEESSFTKGVLEKKICEEAKKQINNLFPNLSNKVEILSFKQGKLKVKVSNSNLVQELKLNQSKIIGQIEEEVEKAEIDKIIFK